MGKYALGVLPYLSARVMLRIAVSQGRSFDRTQSFPVTSHSNPFDTFDIPPPVGFMTNQETFEHAQRVIHKDEARRNELKPYAQTLGEQAHARSSPDRQLPPLKFGEEAMEEEGEAIQRRSPSRLRRKTGMTPSKKRKDEGSDTEVDEEPEPALTFDNSASSVDDFPPVFTSPQISQPDLFATTRKTLPSRLVKGMPGRNLGKTMSAPVGRMGAWNEDKMDVEEDGFDVSEWAASEQF